MTIYDKIRGKTATKPRRPASADQVFDSLAMEGTGYNSPDNLFPNGSHPRRADYARGGIPMKSYKDFQPTAKQYKDAVAPLCSVCGNQCTDWNTASHGVWWCHYCSAKVQASYGPQAMLPLDTGEHLLPALSDRLGKLVCAKCSTNMLPRSDNMGYDCPTCHANYRNPAPTRPGPII